MSISYFEYNYLVTFELRNILSREYSEVFYVHMIESSYR